MYSNAVLLQLVVSLACISGVRGEDIVVSLACISGVRGEVRVPMLWCCSI